MLRWALLKTAGMMLDSDAVKSGEDEIAERMIVRGLVQGVGFRPAVWRIAREFNISGAISNNGDGVEIYACGTAANIRNFAAALEREAPPLARIDGIERIPAEILPAARDFRIEESNRTEIKTGVVPDAAVCDDCRAETLDSSARRFRYPFTNCTNCGPRLSIVQNIPYDRAQTTMREFEMCAECRAEYQDPIDRRFHAQPIACAKCGPKVWLERAAGTPPAVETLTLLDEADAVCTLIERGLIVAIKGIGGFQLACDATNEETVVRLRRLKQRESKPFALMIGDLRTAREYCEIDDLEAEILRSPAAPIVILKRSEPSLEFDSKQTANPKSQIPNPKSQIAPGVAPGVKTLGVMLPNTPLHLLIFRRLKRPMVLTSGNLSDEPQSIDNAEAREKLGRIADYFLMHDRPIAQRVDDSVVKLIDAEPRLLRRARGYAPAPLVLPSGFENAPAVLAFGGELKNTFCLLKNGQAIVSQHLGDLAELAAQIDYRGNLKLYETLYRHAPEVLACDLHPEYLSGKLARAEAREKNLPLVETQHHHAHIAACLAENKVALDAAPVLGVALDGLGYGDDGTFWGGEFLLAGYASYKRLATFKPVALIGGEQAIREPWRNTYAQLVAEMGWARFALNYAELELFEFLDQKPRAIFDTMIGRKLNSPPASSCGRLFDAVAAALGICRERAVYEGQGAVELEQIVDEKTLRDEAEELAYPFAIPRLSGSNLPYIEPFAMWQAVLGDLILKTPVPVIAARFHKGLAKIIVRMIEKLSRFESGAEPVKTVALSGGVWQNKILFEEVVRRLRKNEFEVLTHRRFPTNDGGLSLGQAAIAAARLRDEG
jgi:hydrogenase maturation protein HypF